MKKLAFLVFLAALAPVAFAETPVTIAQLETILVSQRNQTDAKAAKLISSLELTERASTARLVRWEKEFPGKQTQDALLGLADASAFLDPPKSEIPQIADLDATKQDELLASLDDYAKAVVGKLPNFIVRRDTTLFDDLSSFQQFYNKKLEGQVYGDSSRISRPEQPGPLRVAERTTRMVAYRDGQEISSPYEEKGKGVLPSFDVANIGRQIGESSLNPVIVERNVLTPSGEFGPVLATVVGDALRCQISWDHWEQGANGPVAIFRYAVLRERSHYSFDFGAGDGTQFPAYHGEVETDSNSGLRSNPSYAPGAADATQFPAYHGEIAVDPENGAVFRLTVVPDLHSTAFVHIAILVEYDRVVLGKDTRICPQRSVALSTLPERPVQVGTSRDAPQAILIEPRERVSDVAFTGYSQISGSTDVKH